MALLIVRTLFTLMLACLAGWAVSQKRYGTATFYTLTFIWMIQ